MSDISIKREHSLQLDEARTKLNELQEKLDTKFGFNTEWSGNELSFNGKGTKGTIRLNDADVQVEMKLGMFLKPMKSKIEQSIEDGLNKALA